MDPREVYARLLESFGRQNWWPIDREYHLRRGTNPLDEVVIGAVLTQNASWKNAEKALERLKEKGELSLRFVKEVSLERLKELVRPAGFYNQKAVYLKEVASFLLSPRGVLPRREELLKVKGVGRETADAILLYAYGVPTFVVDKYTLRWLERFYGLRTDYEGAKAFFERSVAKNAPVYSEYHALLVELGKRHCRARRPVCGDCPLRDACLLYNSFKK
ncbi:MAG: endonuclease [Aquificae bacterium]|nr:endonuclease [Aquificota bacterium]